MSENNVNGITGADVATTTGIVGATVAIGQYIINDYVITIAATEGDYGYTMTITRGTQTQTVTLYGLTQEQYDAMLGYLQQAQEAAQSAQTAGRDAQVALSRALNAALAAADSESNAAEHASESLEQAGFALQSANDALAARIAAQSAQQQAQAAQTAAETAKTSAQTAQAAAEAARIAAETAETSAGTSASQASQSATNAAQSATDAQHVLDSIPEDYTEVASDVADLKSHVEGIDDEIYPTETKTLYYTDITWERGFLKSDGSEGTSTTYMVSAYLPVAPGDSVAFDGLRSSSSIYPILCGYDSSKNNVSNSNVAGDGTVSQSGTYTVPNGVAFIRVSTYDYYGTIRFNSITMPVVGNRLDDIDDSMESINGRINEIEEALPMYQYTLGFDDYEYTTGKLASKDGEQTRTNGEVTDYISTENMLSVSASNVKMVVLGTSSRIAVIACYDSNKNLLQDKTIFADGTYGQFVQVTALVTITNDIAYIRLSRLGDVQNTGTFTVNMQRTLSEDYDNTKERVNTIERKIDSIWKGKKWYAFGTSLTDDRYLDPNRDPTGKYPGILNQWMQANLVNCGQGGGSITNYNSLIMNKINSTDFSDADLVTLEGFPNDYSMPIGDFLDTTMDTLCGAIYTAVTKIYEEAPKATVVLITASQGQMNEQGTAGYPIDFSEGKQLKFNEATIRMAHYLGCHVIDAGGKAQINNFHPEYLVDHIHHSWAGGWQYAATIWEQMKLIHPNTENPYLTE